MNKLTTDELLAPWLSKDLRCPPHVQTLEAADNPNKTGIDRYFSMRYMGAAEYEFGALPLTLRKMREVLDSIKLMPLGLSDSLTYWYVGTEYAWGYARIYLDYCMPDGQSRGYAARMSGTSKNTDGPKNRLEGRWYAQTDVGWWCVELPWSYPTVRSERPTGWAIFAEQEHAENFLKGLRG